MLCLVRAVTTSLSEALSGEISSVPEESLLGPLLRP